MELCCRYLALAMLILVKFISRFISNLYAFLDDRRTFVDVVSMRRHTAIKHNTNIS